MRKAFAGFSCAVLLAVVASGQAASKAQPLPGLDATVTKVDHAASASLRDCPPGTMTIHNLDITSSVAPGSFLSAGVASVGNLSVDDVRVTSPGDGLSFGANSGVMRRVIVNSGGTGIAVGGPTLTDSLVVAKGMGATGVLTSGATLRNVTAVATGAGSQGLHVPVSQTSPAPSTASPPRSLAAIASR